MDEDSLWLNVWIWVPPIKGHTDMFFFKRKGKENDDPGKTAIKCKHCSMVFEDKERLNIHNKKAHSGKGERKKKAWVKRIRRP